MPSPMAEIQSVTRIRAANAKDAMGYGRQEKRQEQSSTPTPWWSHQIMKMWVPLRRRLIQDVITKSANLGDLDIIPEVCKRATTKIPGYVGQKFVPYTGNRSP
ncbi:hypothetical protein V6N13_093285 [Hibiscus sabdariffa]